MPKHLTITYGDTVLYDDTPEHVSWTDDDGAISVRAGARPEPRRMPPEVADLLKRGVQQAVAKRNGG